jgi:hypothetical protein
LRNPLGTAFAISGYLLADNPNPFYAVHGAFWGTSSPEGSGAFLLSTLVKVHF